MSRRFVVLLIAAVCQTVPAISDAARPNVLFLCSDDQRPDTVHALGNEAIRTPHLDRLVREGTAFTRATCANPICTPSRAEILTGTSGFTNGTLDFGRPIKDDLATWAGTMRRAGYHTWYVGKWHNNGRPTDHGYERTNGLYRGGGGKWDKPATDANGRPVTGYRGWVFQDDDGTKYPEKGVGLTPDISARFADAAIELIESRDKAVGKRNGDQKPFFLHVCFTAPHDPLLMPPGYADMYDPARLPLPKNFLPRHPFDHGNFEGRDEQLFEWPRTPEMVRAELAVYYAVITHLDAQVGRILKALADRDELENTLVIYTSDHGLAVGSHGLRGKQSMYEHTINVPLILRGPGIPAGEKRDAQCYLRDLFPTVCDLVDIPIPKTVEGRSLQPVLSGEQDEVYPAVFGYFRNFQRMVRQDGWKLIKYPQAGRTQLFDLKNDPHELRNLIDDPAHADRAAALRKTLRAWQREVNDPALTEAN